MHTYRQTEPRVWTVGFDVSTPEESAFAALKDFGSETAAAAYASYLNGGDHPEKPWPTEVV